MTKDLAICVKKKSITTEDYVNTEDFLNALDNNLKKKLNL